MGAVGTMASVGGDETAVGVIGINVGITAVGGDKTAVDGGGVTVNDEETAVAIVIAPTVASAGCVGTNGVGVGAADPHATSSQKLNDSRSENGSFRTMQFIKTKLYHDPHLFSGLQITLQL